MSKQSLSIPGLRKHNMSCFFMMSWHGKQYPILKVHSEYFFQNSITSFDNSEDPDQLASDHDPQFFVHTMNQN